ncbi:carboxypeptidase-like regulatory domain-containing protein [Sphingobacterium bovistauri]|uniref:Carboxypeptidase-like regulatory domain-containing protein n=1 Tax=Sphingobacterium bovistauri TaxID=2781959 RepID=A0ABS7Z8A3_9SPHI|nr:carboxypeptidase-like regulatory domain-containing protein [Sphingobacterium bovistauri]MCA5005095.1 carboxypeptidase-like regulatory domain-containing protein [Sphingobacterium bovistauri]
MFTKSKDRNKVNSCISFKKKLALVFITLTIQFVIPIDGVKAEVTTDKYQQIIIKGNVLTIDGKPIVGANIRSKDRKHATKTNDKGEFKLTLGDKIEDIEISMLGYNTVKIPARKIRENQDLVIQLETKNNEIEEINISAQAVPSVKIDLTNRKHLNLGQILEGTVPGLTVKRDLKTEVEYTISDFQSAATYKMRFLTEEEFYNIKNYNIFPKVTNPHFYNTDYISTNAGHQTYQDYINESTSRGTQGSNRLSSSTSTKDNGLQFEMLGASGIDNKSLLLVIDGFVQSKIPENFPLNNIETVEIIRDPLECAKWGPDAMNGIIKITSKQGTAGKLSFDYSSNVYISNKSDNSPENLNLVSSQDVLDFYKELYDNKLLFNANLSGVNHNFVPAKQLLYELDKKMITEDMFKTKWDSLSSISNYEQINSLYRPAVRQNHSLSISGGTEKYNAVFSGLYAYDKLNTIRNSESRYGLSLQNNFNLLDGNLKAKLFVTYNKELGHSSQFEIPNNFDPYQLLLDQNGNYVYDYSTGTFSKALNDVNITRGFLDNGKNAIEDANASDNKRILNNYQTLLNLNWNITKNLDFDLGGKFFIEKAKSNNYTGENHSSTRNQINLYREYINTTSLKTASTYMIPYGGILRRTDENKDNWDLRASLKYRYQINNRNKISFFVGGTGSSTNTEGIPYQTIYGYNDEYSHGLPIVSDNTKSINSVVNGLIRTDNLLNINAASAYNDKNLGFNGKISYQLDNFLQIDATKTYSYFPRPYVSPSYTQTSLSTLDATLDILNLYFKNKGIFNHFTFKTGFKELKTSDLTQQGIRGNYISQLEWKESVRAIVINNFDMTQHQNGTNRNILSDISLGLLKGALVMNANYFQPFDEKGNISGNISYTNAVNKFGISNFAINLSLVNLSPIQKLILGLNTSLDPNAIGISPSALGQRRESSSNRNIVLTLGFLENRITLESRYYNTQLTGLSFSGIVPVDPTTGLTTNIWFGGRSKNEGMTFGLNTEILKAGVNKLGWRMNIVGTYNQSSVDGLPTARKLNTTNPLTLQYNGANQNILRSFSWAGLNEQGHPQIYSTNDNKLTFDGDRSKTYTLADTTIKIVNSGLSRAPWSGGVNPSFEYNGFFASGRIIFNLGHVMRRYIPAPTDVLDSDKLMRERWSESGDELNTDVPKIMQQSYYRTLVTQNSDNSILPADHIRLREIQLGYTFPKNMLQNLRLNALTLSFQMMNVGLWAKNNYGIDPEAITNVGKLIPQQPKQYIFSLNVNF